MGGHWHLGPVGWHFLALWEVRLRVYPLVWDCFWSVWDGRGWEWRWVVVDTYR